MKNLFLSVVLLLTVSFAFAANDVEKVLTFDVEETLEMTNSVELINSIKLAEVDFIVEDVIVRCCTASSEDVEVTVCGKSSPCTTAGEILDIILK